MKKLVVILFVIVPFFGNAQFFDYSASLEGGYFQGNRIQSKNISSLAYPDQKQRISLFYPTYTFYNTLNFNLHFATVKLI